jgi:4-amino-4-deoxy-L-arabinose transferase-like glycosyltransferase
MNVINKYIYNIYTIISISVVLRFLLLNEYGDTELDYEWKTIFYNLKNHGIFAYRSFHGELIPTVYMPPLYAYFIFCIDLFFVYEDSHLVTSILITQIFISTISILLFYKINLIFFSKKISLFSSLIFCFFPLYVYSCLQVSSISLQIFFNLIFLFLILKILKGTNDLKSNIILGLISGLSMLLRGEFILIFLISLIYLKFFRFINLRQSMVIFLISILIISPYLIRNYLNFEKITITKSFGYNLWKGNNIDANIEGSESVLAFQTGDIIEKINNLKKDKLYDFNYDKIFLDYSLETIRAKPMLFLERYLKKFLSLTFFNLNSDYPKYFNLLNIIPIFLLSIFFILSMIFARQKNFSYYYLIFNLFLTIGIFSVFFILPRYKLIILPLQLILINFLIVKILKFIINKNNL